MRVTRFLMVLLALAAAGCARQPVMRVQMAVAPQGIDNVIYGAAPGYGMAAAPAYGTAAAPVYATPPAYAPPPAPGYAMAPAPTYAPAPGYAPAAAPAYAMPAPAPAYGVAVAQSGAGVRGLTGGMPYGGGRAVATPIGYATARSAYPVAYPPVAQPPYTLDSGDRLRIVVFGQDGLTNSYVLDASGQLAMPLIGSVSARGLTTEQLSQRIADLLRNGFIREPHVAVEIEAYRPFFILGEVAQPGQYPYVANMTVETAVAIAGGFGPRGYHKAVIITRHSNGQVTRFETPIGSPICPGDTIQVQERWF